MDVNNTQRAEWARNAVLPFAKETGLQYDIEKQEAISDLICDLLHLANQEGLDTDVVLRSATNNFECEKEGWE